MATDGLIGINSTTLECANTGEGVEALLTVGEPIACQEASIFKASSCTGASKSAYDKRREMARKPVAMFQGQTALLDPTFARVRRTDVASKPL